MTVEIKMEVSEKRNGLEFRRKQKIDSKNGSEGEGGRSTTVKNLIIDNFFCVFEWLYAHVIEHRYMQYVTLHQHEEHLFFTSLQWNTTFYLNEKEDKNNSNNTK